MALSDLVRLFGTDESVESPRLLKAGPLTVELEAGNLRYVRYYGHEMIRAISFVVRDKNWGTYAPAIENLYVQEGPEAFRLSYSAVAGGNDQKFSYEVMIEGLADGSLVFSANGIADTDFLTNRTGFVVLHPIEGVVGAPCQVERVNGSIENVNFPFLIDPVQPIREIRSLTHEFQPGLRVNCRMEGDVFEMEDQRNWTDASYKTYVRPLALPWPYLLEEGERLSQKVSLSVSGKIGLLEVADTAVTISLAKDVEDRSMPPLGFGLDPKHLSATEDRLDLLRAADPAHIVCYYHPGAGHAFADLKRMAAIARELEAETWIEFVVPTVERFERDIEEFGKAVVQLEYPITAVMVSPAPDLKCTLPGTPWPPCPPLQACYQAVRKVLPSVRLGGGMFSFFTELNRKRPPVEELDFLTFTTVAIFHAGDDRSAMEGLESLPYIARSVKEFAGGKPFHVGPSAIGLRANPYGECPMPNPQNVRQAMNGMDPRQRGLFGAAWYLGFVARFAENGAFALTIGSGVGEFGIVHAGTNYTQPWFDQNGGVYPAYHVFRVLAALGNSPLVKLNISKPREVQALAVRRNGSTELWTANLTGQPQTVRFGQSLTGELSVLDASVFERAACDASFLDNVKRPFTGNELTLKAYEVIGIRFATP